MSGPRYSPHYGSIPGGGPGFKSFTHPQTQSGTQYLGGFYNAPAADANLTQASTTVTHGAALNAHGAHAFIVAGGAGSVDAGTVSIVVSGNSISDQGVRVVGDSETIVADITALALDQYVETTRKWLGQVIYTLTPAGAATYSVDINYGFAKYDDFGNRDFVLTDFENVFHSDANETDLDIILYHHSVNDWTYSAAAFAPGGTIVAQMSADYSTDDNLNTGNYGAYKRDDLSTYVHGNNGEGFIVKLITAVNNSMHHVNVHIGASF